MDELSVLNHQEYKDDMMSFYNYYFLRNMLLPVIKVLKFISYYCVCFLRKQPVWHGCS